MRAQAFFSPQLKRVAGPPAFWAFMANGGMTDAQGGAGRDVMDIAGRRVGTRAGGCAYGTSPGPTGNYLLNDGVDGSHVVFPLRAILGSFSVGCRLRPDSPFDVRYIAAHDDGTGGATGWRIGISSGNPILTFSGVALYTFSGLSFAALQWHSLRVAVNGSTGTATCYLLPDGGTLASQTISISPPLPTPTQLSIGELTWTTGTGYQGAIQDFVIYPYAQTDQQVLADFTDPYRWLRDRDDDVAAFLGRPNARFRRTLFSRTGARGAILT